jgi:putative membrane protein
MMHTVTVADLFTRWDIPWAVTCALVLTGVVYTRGWLRIRRTRPEQFPRWRLYCFLGGLLALFIAVSSPLDTFSESLLFMHMAQHWVLMSIAPPLVIFGAPVVPMMRGLPRWIIRRPLRPFFKTRALHRIGGFLTRPRVAWLAMNAAYLGWHIPRAYEFALSSENWHNCEHACFFFTNLLFWWPIIQPWPARPRFSRWMLIPYLGLADIVNTGIAGFLCFCGRLLYPSYEAVPRAFGLSALNDQVAAGAFMWICGSMVYMIAGVVIIAQLLSSRPENRREPVPPGAEDAWWTPAPPVKHREGSI